MSPPPPSALPPPPSSMTMTMERSESSYGSAGILHLAMVATQLHSTESHPPPPSTTERATLSPALVPSHSLVTTSETATMEQLLSFRHDLQKEVNQAQLSSTQLLAQITRGTNFLTQLDRQIHLSSTSTSTVAGAGADERIRSVPLARKSVGNSVRVSVWPITSVLPVSSSMTTSLSSDEISNGSVTSSIGVEGEGGRGGGRGSSNGESGRGASVVEDLQDYLLGLPEYEAIPISSRHRV